MDCRVHPCASPSHTPVSAHLQQLETSPCPSPHVCLSNNHDASTGIGLPPSSLQHIRYVVVGSPGCLTTASQLFANDQSAASSAYIVSSFLKGCVRE
jgi:hypothetical protein